MHVPKEGSKHVPKEHARTGAKAERSTTALQIDYSE
jgi:hypothetical protein